MMRGCTRCNATISISNIPGGNPFAKLHGGILFRTHYGKCDRCEEWYCDECLVSSGEKCPACGRRVAIQGPPEGVTPKLPEGMQRALEKLERFEPLGDAPAAPKRTQGLRFIAIIGVIALIIYGATFVLPPDTALNGIATFFSRSMALLLLLCLSPLVGVVVTGIPGAILMRATGNNSTMRSLLGKALLLNLLLLLMSIWPPLHLYYRSYLSAWAAAALLVFLVGFFLGSLQFLSRAMNARPN